MSVHDLDTGNEFGGTGREGPDPPASSPNASLLTGIQIGFSFTSVISRGLGEL